MKKVIESELISIAHRILKMNDHTPTDILLLETEKLYQKLVVLKFYEDHKFRLDATVTQEKIEELLMHETSVAPLTQQREDVEQQREEPASTIENKGIEAPTDSLAAQEVENVNVTQEVEIPVSEDSDPEHASEPTLDPEPASDGAEQESPVQKEFQHAATSEEQKQGEELSQQPMPDAKEALDIHKETDTEAIESETAKVEFSQEIQIDPIYQISFDQIAFEKAPSKTTISTESEEVTAQADEVPTIMENQHFVTNQSATKNEVPFHQIPLNKTINDAFSNMVTIGLNDRIAFEKHLFNNSSEDLNRVISQLNTIETFQEAKDFIDDLVKPDFNFWQGKDEYAHRFMTMIEKRFL